MPSKVLAVLKKILIPMFKSFKQGITNLLKKAPFSYI